MRHHHIINCPEWALPALINDDFSNLPPEDIQTLERWKTSVGFQWAEMCEDRSPFFTHSPEFGKSCMCYEVLVELEDGL